MNTSNPQIQLIDYRKLQLDLQNPRFARQDNQQDALAALVADAPEKLIRLARDIKAYGLDPINPVLVTLQQNDYYNVLEGNRRLAAVRLLHGQGVEHVPSNLEYMLPEAYDPSTVTLVQCVILPTREAAQHWLELRHTGENQGVGVVRWSTAQRERFRPTRTHAAKGLDFLRLARRLDPSDPKLQEACDLIERSKITTLGRIVGDPNVRKELGLLYSLGDFEILDLPDADEKFRLLTIEIAAEVTVSQVKNVDQRTEYITDFLYRISADRSSGEESSTRKEDDQTERDAETKSDESGQSDESSQDSSSTDTSSQRTRGKQRTKSDAVHETVLQEIDLSNFDSRLAAIIGEIKSLRVEDYPNALGILIRCLLDMTTLEFLEHQGTIARNTPFSQLPSFANRIKMALSALDPQAADSALSAVRSGMATKHHIFSAKTLHQYVHNRFWNPTPQEIRSIASNIEPLLGQMNDALGP